MRLSKEYTRKRRRERRKEDEERVRKGERKR